MNRSPTPGSAESPTRPRWSGRSRWPAIAVVVATAAAVIAGGGGSVRSVVWSPARALTPAACSAKAPATLSREGWSAARHVLAPPGAGTIRLCRYSGLNARPPLALVASRRLESRRLVRRLVREFDRLPALRGVVACPNDDLSQIIALLSYPAGRLVSINVGLSGCALVTNGSVHRTAAGFGTPPPFGPQLVAQLEQLAGPRPRP
jgi:hypothetical protein